MPKWRKGQVDFTVNVNYNPKRGYQSSIPIPIMDMLGQPRKIAFLVRKASNPLVIEVLPG